VAIDREKVRQAAEKFVEKKKYDKAVLEYQKLVQADPADARTLLKIGDLQTKMTAFADAIGTYETVGKLYSQQGFSLKAIAVYKQIREIIAKHVPQLDEKYSHISPKLAELYQSLGLTSDALAALDEVATRLQRQQRDPEAIEVFRKIVDLDPTNPLPHLRLAEALSRIKDVEGAVFEFKTAASQLAGLGRRDDALKVLERLLHHKPDAEQARIAAELYLARGQPADGMQALSKLQLCFQANPRDFDTLSLLARAFTVIGQAAKAIEVQKEMARVARDAGKHDLFREIVERLARLAPQDDGVRKLLAQSAPEAAPPPVAPPQPMGQMGAGQMGAGQMGAGLPQPPAMRQPAFQPPPQQAYQPPPQAAAFGSPPQAYQPPQPQAYQPPPPQQAYQPPQPQAWGQQQAQAPQQAYELPEEPAYEEEQQYEEPADYEMVEEDDLVAEAEPEAEPVYEEEAPPEEIPEQDPAEQIAQILADAASFRRVRLYTKAVETLRVGLDLDPRSMDVHEAYRDTLIEAGHTEEAIDEMLAIAGLYVDALDGDSAARALQDVLAFDPENARAIEMLQELGYEIVDEGQEGQLEGDAEPAYEGDPEMAAQEPLPSYDLEGVGPEHVSGGFRAAEADTGADFGGDDALPSFPLDGPSTEDQPYAEEPQAYAEGNEVAYADPQDEYAATEGEITDGDRAGGYATDEQAALGAGTDRPPAGSPSMSARAQDLEDALEEAEFFMSRGLNEDARAILVEQLTRHPHNPLLQERIAEIDAQLEAMGQGSGARERPRYEDRAFDIAASLDALDGLEGASVPEAQAMMGADEQIDVEEVFAKFKEGVAKQISIEDSESHYNLGIAYKEMGLIDDAIREFEVAARDPKRECVCQSMIGAIYVERGNLNGAIEALLKGIASPGKEPQQELMLWFEVASCYEAKKLGKDALSYYQKVAKRDPGYRDVQERIQRLSKGEAKSAVRQVAVGADDEFDQAFDDIIGKS